MKPLLVFLAMLSLSRGQGTCTADNEQTSCVCSLSDGRKIDLRSVGKQDGATPAWVVKKLQSRITTYMSPTRCPLLTYLTNCSPAVPPFASHISLLLRSTVMQRRASWANFKGHASLLAEDRLDPWPCTLEWQPRKIEISCKICKQILQKRCPLTCSTAIFACKFLAVKMSFSCKNLGNLQ